MKSDTMKLDKKLFECRVSIEQLHKDARGPNHQYVSGMQILDKIRKVIDDKQLLLEPCLTEIKISEITFGVGQIKLSNGVYSEGKKATEPIVYGTMYWRWTDVESGEYKDIPWTYSGQMGDIAQALGSALTYTERYFLCKYFQLPTDEYDPDKPGNSISAGENSGVVPTVTYMDQTTYNEVMSKGSLKFLIEKYKEWNTEEKRMLPVHKKALEKVLKDNNKLEEVKKNG